MIRRATVRSLAKLNLDLRVLHKRMDGFHELRTVFQTISLADTLAIEFEPGRRSSIHADVIADGETLDIPDNLVVRAAQLVMDAAKVKGRASFRLNKTIPMGGGLGGGSSNAAAVLLALPALMGRAVPYEKLMEMGASLGSDVPFFLEGGTSLAVDRGTEIYPLADIAEEPILVIASGIHVETGPAYKALNREVLNLGAEAGGKSDLRGQSLTPPVGPAKLTSPDLSRRINSFQCFVRALGEVRSAKAASAFSANDFEPAAFGQHPPLKRLADKLRKHAGPGGAVGARMTGSGSTLFAIFGSIAERDAAGKSLQYDRVFGGCRVIPARLVSRRSYRRLWFQQLAGHVDSDKGLWPPQSRHER
ncbi:MAG: 4-(cytidine 5'-diphospho)-2-C-methyl-D-erythritol kinase [Bryobacteraceae bacterium]